MATLKIKSDLILLLRKLKNLWIQILFFRVAKFWLSGLPYLRRGSIDDFLINVILWFRVLKKENNSQKSSEHIMKTYSLQAFCGPVPRLWNLDFQCFHFQSSSIHLTTLKLLVTLYGNLIWYNISLEFRWIFVHSINCLPRMFLILSRLYFFLWTTSHIRIALRFQAPGMLN